MVETDARQAKGRYLEALHALQARWRTETERRGGIFMTVNTAEEPLTVLQRLIREIAQAAP